MVQRKLANIQWLAAGGKASDFDNFWPLAQNKNIEKRVWGATKEEAIKMRNEIMKAHNKVLK